MHSLEVIFLLNMGKHFYTFQNLERLYIYQKNLNQDNKLRYKNMNKTVSNSYHIKIILYLSFYSLVMVLLAITKNFYNYFYLIPVFFQLSHFYLDGFIWRFSDSHIRNNVGKYLFG